MRLRTELPVGAGGRSALRARPGRPVHSSFRWHPAALAQLKSGGVSRPGERLPPGQTAVLAPQPPGVPAGVLAAGQWQRRLPGWDSDRRCGFTVLS